MTVISLRPEHRQFGIYINMAIIIPDQNTAQWMNMTVITPRAAHIKLVICMNMADIIPRPEHRMYNG